MDKAERRAKQLIQDRSSASWKPGAAALQAKDQRGFRRLFQKIRYKYYTMHPPVHRYRIPVIHRNHLESEDTLLPLFRLLF